MELKKLLMTALGLILVVVFAACNDNNGSMLLNNDAASLAAIESSYDETFVKYKIVDGVIEEVIRKKPVEWTRGESLQIGVCYEFKSVSDAIEASRDNPIYKRVIDQLLAEAGITKQKSVAELATSPACINGDWSAGSDIHIVPGMPLFQCRGGTAQPANIPGTKYHALAYIVNGTNVKTDIIEDNSLNIVSYEQGQDILVLYTPLPITVLAVSSVWEGIYSRCNHTETAVYQ